MGRKKKHWLPSGMQPLWRARHLSLSLCARVMITVLFTCWNQCNCAFVSMLQHKPESPANFTLLARLLYTSTGRKGARGAQLCHCRLGPFPIHSFTVPALRNSISQYLLCLSLARACISVILKFGLTSRTYNININSRIGKMSNLLQFHFSPLSTSSLPYLHRSGVP